MKVLSENSGNYNKVAMFVCKSGFHQSEEKCNCHIYVTSVMIITLILFLLEKCIISCYFSISFLAYVCILYPHVVQECVFGIK